VVCLLRLSDYTLSIELSLFVDDLVDEGDKSLRNNEDNFLSIEVFIDGQSNGQCFFDEKRRLLESGFLVDHLGESVDGPIKESLHLKAYMKPRYVTFFMVSVFILYTVTKF